jgi:hypothetical protein
MNNRNFFVFNVIFLFGLSGLLLALYFSAKNTFDTNVTKFNREMQIKQDNIKHLEKQLLANQNKATIKQDKNSFNAKDEFMIKKLTAKIEELEQELKQEKIKYKKLSLKSETIKPDTSMSITNAKSQNTKTKKECNCKEKIKYITKKKIEYKTKIVEKKIPCIDRKKEYDLEEIRMLQDDFNYFKQSLSSIDPRLVCGTDMLGNIAYPIECQDYKSKKSQAKQILKKIEVLANDNNVTKIYEDFLNKSKVSLK